MSAVVVGYSYYGAPGGAYKTLDMTIEVTATNAKFCARGDRGTLKLLQTTQRLKNGALGDAVGLSWPAGRCPTFYQGWINADGGAKTSPPRRRPAERRPMGDRQHLAVNHFRALSGAGGRPVRCRQHVRPEISCSGSTR